MGKPPPLTLREQMIAADIMEQGFDVGWAVETARRLVLLDVTALTMNTRQAAKVLDVKPQTVNEHRHKGNLKPIALHTDPETNWPTDTVYLRADVRLLCLQLKVRDPFGGGSRRWTPPTEKEILEYLRGRGIHSPLPGY